MSVFTDKVASQCRTELARFNNGEGTETEDPFFKFVGEYWSFGLDGRTTFQDSRGRPFRPAWSAAFISFIMRKAGAGDEFFYSEAHIHYAVKAIRDAQNGVPAKFLGRDPTIQKPKVGDIINAGRGDSAGVTFATVLRKYGKDPVPNGNFLASHSDIVVSIDAANKKLKTVGGNVGDSVSEKTWTLKADGTLSKGPTLICVIETLL